MSPLIETLTKANALSSQVMAALIEHLKVTERVLDEGPTTETLEALKDSYRAIQRLVKGS